MDAQVGEWMDMRWTDRWVQGGVETRADPPSLVKIAHLSIAFLTLLLQISIENTPCITIGVLEQWAAFTRHWSTLVD